MSFRRGACPALSAPMQTGDGLLVRLATAGASLTPAQLVALCATAERHGNGLVEITARGNFQIRGLTAESATALAHDIHAMDLGLRDGVPVETNPLAGMDPTEIANPAPLAAMIREAIDSTDLAARLGPKVSIVIDGGGADALSALPADVRLTAVGQDTGTDAGKTVPAAGRETAAGWLVSTGGDATTATPHGTVQDDATAVDATLAILEAIATHSRDARARDLAPAEMTALLSPLTGRGCRQAGEGRHEGARPPSPLWGGSDRRSGVAADKTLPVHPHPAASSSLREATAPTLPTRGRVYAAILLSDGRIALPVTLPFGSIRAGELAAFIEETQPHATELRLAPGRRLIPICASQAAASAVLNAARAAGLIVDAADPRARIFACPGSAGCASGHFAAREIAASVARELDGAEGPDFELHISGCPKGCAHPAPAALTLAGTENGPVLIENGTAREAGIPFGNQDIAARLASAIRDRSNSRSQPETRRKPHPAHAFAGD